MLLPPALATGNLEIRCDAMVREVLVNSAGLASGVSYIDKKTRREVQARGKDRGARCQRLRDGSPAA